VGSGTISMCAAQMICLISHLLFEDTTSICSIIIFYKHAVLIADWWLLLLLFWGRIIMPKLVMKKEII
jgi:hypothetical protein